MHYAVVKVIAAQPGIAVCGQHFKYAVPYFQNGNVKRTAAQVVNQYLMVAFLIQAIGQRSSRRLVYYAQHFQTGYLARVLGRLALAVRKICRNGYNRLSYRLAQIALGVLFKLHQYHGRNFLRGVFLTLHLGLVIGTHLPFDGYNGIVRIGYGLALSNSAHHALPVLRRYNRRSSPAALGVRDNNGFAALHYRHAGISGS